MYTICFVVYYYYYDDDDDDDDGRLFVLLLLLYPTAIGQAEGAFIIRHYRSSPFCTVSCINCGHRRHPTMTAGIKIYCYCDLFTFTVCDCL